MMQCPSADLFGRRDADWFDWCSTIIPNLRARVERQPICGVGAFYSETSSPIVRLLCTSTGWIFVHKASGMTNVGACCNGRALLKAALLCVSISLFAQPMQCYEKKAAVLPKLVLHLARICDKRLLHPPAPALRLGLPLQFGWQHHGQGDENIEIAFELWFPSLLMHSLCKLREDSKFHRVVIPRHHLTNCSDHCEIMQVLECAFSGFGRKRDVVCMDKARAAAETYPTAPGHLSVKVGALSSTRSIVTEPMQNSYRCSAAHSNPTLVTTWLNALRGRKQAVLAARSRFPLSAVGTIIHVHFDAKFRPTQLQIAHDRWPPKLPSPELHPPRHMAPDTTQSIRSADCISSVVRLLAALCAIFVCKQVFCRPRLNADGMTAQRARVSDLAETTHMPASADVSSAIHDDSPNADTSRHRCPSAAHTLSAVTFPQAQSILVSHCAVVPAATHVSPLPSEPTPVVLARLSPQQEPPSCKSMSTWGSVKCAESDDVPLVASRPLWKPTEVIPRTLNWQAQCNQEVARLQRLIAGTTPQSNSRKRKRVASLEQSRDASRRKPRLHISAIPHNVSQDAIFAERVTILHRFFDWHTQLDGTGMEVQSGAKVKAGGHAARRLQYTVT